MWRSHFVVLGEEPSENNLARVKDGYQLFRETRTSLYYLAAHSKPLARRPDFGQFLDRKILQKIDASFLERFLSGESGAVDVKNHEVNFDLIQCAATLSKQLQMHVLAAEDTDDEYGMAVGVGNGAVTYLRFKTMLKESPEDKGAVEVVYTSEIGFSIDREPADDAYGVAQKAIDEVYGESELNLYNYSDAKPTRAEARKHTAASKLSVQAYLDSYGVFKRLSHAPPQLTTLERILRPFQFLMSAIFIPFLFVGMMIYVMIYAGKQDVDQDPSPSKLGLIGLIVLAFPLWFLVWLVRKILGY
ncbi:hypothetical protein [Sphingorhabdus sp. EL138]|uniref:hypothetical protein n=1 Tax=Sphingorhabdus sp. EL138 TaxID=2073156 RepID=UPI000D685433|nr:hypothetical protein [Sphingorhabdus sp. EL138]